MAAGYLAATRAAEHAVEHARDQKEDLERAMLGCQRRVPRNAVCMIMQHSAWRDHSMIQIAFRGTRRTG
jgi:hypothetical protein